MPSAQDQAVVPTAYQEQVQPRQHQSAHLVIRAGIKMVVAVMEMLIPLHARHVFLASILSKNAMLTKFG
jgi:hypothetical protein|tara:strand:- start:48 stop:254 length:207 start_codon:yes stop_codon:yes gene_type:complete